MSSSPATTKKYEQEKPINKKTLAALIVGGTLALALTGCAPTSPETACTVTDKDRSNNSDGKSIYRVYSDCGVFNVEDAPFVGVFNAADTYATIEVGKTYEFTTYGYRNGFLSIFPNITEAAEVTP